MKSLFFVLFVCVLSFPVVGMDNNLIGPFGSPPRVAATINVARDFPALTGQQIIAVEQLLENCVTQIGNIHKLFSTEHTESEKPIIAVAAIKKSFQSLLEPVFIRYFSPEKRKHFTPECVRALGSHFKDTKNDSSEEFLSKGDADFIKSTDLNDFYSIMTHHRNTFFIPRWQVNTENGFALWRKSTNTLREGILFGVYNVLRLLEGSNPESHSGTLEHHHVFQRQTPVTPVCRSEHKGKTKKYHKSEDESAIDRSICGTEFYFVNKLTGLLQVARMCERVLREIDCAKLSSIGLMDYIKQYSGNINIIANGAEVVKKFKPGIPEAFAQQSLQFGQLTQKIEQVNDEEDAATVVAIFDRRDSWCSGHTDSADNSRLSYTSSSESGGEEEKPYVSKRKNPLSPIREYKRSDNRKTHPKIGKENSDYNAGTDDFAAMFLGASQEKTVFDGL